MARIPFALFINAHHRFFCHFLSAIAWHWLESNVGQCCTATCELQDSPPPRVRVESSSLTSEWKEARFLFCTWITKEERKCFWKGDKKASWRMDIWVLAAWWSRPRRIWQSGFRAGMLGLFAFGLITYWEKRACLVSAARCCETNIETIQYLSAEYFWEGHC